MGEKITYDYFYGGQLEAFSYYRLPRVLVTGQQFRGLSTDAKLLYALLLDRMGLSSRNGWYDEQGRVYIYYPVEEIEEDIGCGHGKAVRLLAELDSAKGIGLIERVRQGQGRPTKIFVKQFTTVEVPDFPCPPPPTGGEPMPTSTKMGCQEVPKADGQKYQTHTSGLPKTGSLDVPKSNGNYNNINYPYESYLDLSIHPSYRLPVNETDRRAVLAELRENIDYPHLAARYGGDLSDIIDLTYRLDCYTLLPEIRNYEDYGYHLVESRRDFYLPQKARYYFDFSQYGEDTIINEGGTLTPQGYIRADRGKVFTQVYDGEHIPAEYRVFQYPMEARAKERQPAHRPDASIEKG